MSDVAEPSACRSPIAVWAVDHVVLRVRDVDRALAFYCGVLGCREERRVPEIGLIQLRAGASLIDLVAAPASAEAPGSSAGGTAEPASSAAAGSPNMDHFALRLATFAPARIQAHLAAHGVAAGPVERRYGAQGFGPSIYVTDPDGNIVELKGPPDPA